jgi:hypothetical protein
MMFVRRSVPSACALALLAACGDDGGTSTVPATPRAIAVLDGFIQPGLTLVPDSGTTTQRLPFGAPTEFDGASVEIRNDTALAASSRGAGDLLYLADLRVGTVRRFQMPARSNPARARLLQGSSGRPLIGVPLRDAGAVALVSLLPDGSFATASIGELGTCPVDVFQYGGDLWVLDANAACATTYRANGATRLVRIPPGGGARQVITLDGLRGSDAGVVVVGDVAYVTAGGDADFSGFPFTLNASGAIARVDLRARTVLGTRPLPAGSYGGGAKLGRDGNLHVSLFEDLSSFRNRVISYRLPDLTPTGTRVTGADWRSLRSATGAEMACGSAMADGLGRLHCIQNRTGSATFLLVFAPDGSLVREVAAGQGGVDLAFR